MILEGLNAELEATKSDISKRDEEIKFLKDLISKSEAEHKSLATKVESSAHEVVKTCREEIARLAQEKGDLELRLRSAEQEKSNASGVESGGDEMTKMIMESLTTELDGAKAELAKCREELKAAKQEQEKSGGDETTKMIMESLTIELDGAKSALDAREKEVLELKACVEELSKLLEEDKLEKLQKENSALSAEVQGLKARLVEAEKKAEASKGLSPRTDAPASGETLQEKLARMKAGAVSSSTETPAEKLARLKAETAAASVPAVSGETPAEKLARLKASIQK